MVVGYTEVINGPPTVVYSESSNPQTIIETIGIARENKKGPVPSTAVTAALLVQIDQTPAEIVFHVENSDSSTSFTCILTGKSVYLYALNSLCGLKVRVQRSYIFLFQNQISIQCFYQK